MLGLSVVGSNVSVSRRSWGVFWTSRSYLNTVTLMSRSHLFLKTVTSWSRHHMSHFYGTSKFKFIT